VNTENVDVGDLESDTLETADDPVEGAGSVGSGEDVLVHEETPVRRREFGSAPVCWSGVRGDEKRDAPLEVLVLPGRTDTGDLEDEDTIVLEVVVDVAEEGVVTTDTDVLQKGSVSLA
jgi:hypothetical protein